MEKPFSLIVRVNRLPFDFDKKKIENNCLRRSKGKLFFVSFYKKKKIRRYCTVLYDQKKNINDLTLFSASYWSPFHMSKKQRRFKWLILRFK